MIQINQSIFFVVPYASSLVRSKKNSFVQTGNLRCLNNGRRLNTMSNGYVDPKPYSKVVLDYQSTVILNPSRMTRRIVSLLNMHYLLVVLHEVQPPPVAVLHEMHVSRHDINVMHVSRMHVSRLINWCMIAI